MDYKTFLKLGINPKELLNHDIDNDTINLNEVEVRIDPIDDEDSVDKESLREFLVDQDSFSDMIQNTKNYINAKYDNLLQEIADKFDQYEQEILNQKLRDPLVKVYGPISGYAKSENFNNTDLMSKVTSELSGGLIMSDLVVTADTDTMIKVEWDLVSGADKYKVYLNGSYLEETTNDYYEFTGLEHTTNYLIEVSAYENASSFETPKKSINWRTDSVSVVLNITPSLNSAQIEWNYDLGRDLIKFMIYIDDRHIDDIMYNPSVGSYSIVIDNLTPGTNYEAKLVAYTGNRVCDIESFTTSDIDLSPIINSVSIGLENDSTYYYDTDSPEPLQEPVCITIDRSGVVSKVNALVQYNIDGGSWHTINEIYGKNLTTHVFTSNQIKIYWADYYDIIDSENINFKVTLINADSPSYTDEITTEDSIIIDNIPFKLKVDEMSVTNITEEKMDIRFKVSNSINCNPLINSAGSVKLEYYYSTDDGSTWNSFGNISEEIISGQITDFNKSVQWDYKDDLGEDQYDIKIKIIPYYSEKTGQPAGIEYISDVIMVDTRDENIFNGTISDLEAIIKTGPNSYDWNDVDVSWNSEEYDKFELEIYKENGERKKRYDLERAIPDDILMLTGILGLEYTDGIYEFRMYAKDPETEQKSTSHISDFAALYIPQPNIKLSFDKVSRNIEIDILDFETKPEYISLFYFEVYKLDSSGEIIESSLITKESGQLQTTINVNEVGVNYKVFPYSKNNQNKYNIHEYFLTGHEIFAEEIISENDFDINEQIVSDLQVISFNDHGFDLSWKHERQDCSYIVKFESETLPGTIEEYEVESKNFNGTTRTSLSNDNGIYLISVTVKRDEEISEQTNEIHKALRVISPIAQNSHNPGSFIITAGLDEYKEFSWSKIKIICRDRINNIIDSKYLYSIDDSPVSFNIPREDEMYAIETIAYNMDDIPAENVGRKTIHAKELIRENDEVVDSIFIDNIQSNKMRINWIHDSSNYTYKIIVNSSLNDYNKTFNDVVGNNITLDDVSYEDGIYTIEIFTIDSSGILSDDSKTKDVCLYIPAPYFDFTYDDTDKKLNIDIVSDKPYYNGINVQMFDNSDINDREFNYNTDLSKGVLHDEKFYDVPDKNITCVIKVKNLLNGYSTLTRQKMTSTYEVPIAPNNELVDHVVIPNDNLTESSMLVSWTHSTSETYKYQLVILSSLDSSFRKEIDNISGTQTVISDLDNTKGIYTVRVHTIDIHGQIASDYKSASKALICHNPGFVFDITPDPVTAGDDSLSLNISVNVDSIPEYWNNIKFEILGVNEGEDPRDSIRSSMMRKTTNFIHNEIIKEDWTVIMKIENLTGQFSQSHTVQKTINREDEIEVTPISGTLSPWVNDTPELIIEWTDTGAAEYEVTINDSSTIGTIHRTVSTNSINLASHLSKSNHWEYGQYYNAGSSDPAGYVDIMITPSCGGPTTDNIRVINFGNMWDYR